MYIGIHFDSGYDNIFFRIKKNSENLGIYLVLDKKISGCAKWYLFNKCLLIKTIIFSIS